MSKSPRCQPRNGPVFAKILPLLVLLTALMGCEGESAAPTPPPTTEEPALGVRIAPVLAACSGAAPGARDGQATVSVTDATGEVIASASGAFSFDGAGISVPGIPEGNQRTLTVTGALSDGTSIYGRTRGITIEPQKSVNIDMMLVRNGDFGCLEVPSSFGGLLFPAVVALPDGRVLVFGGFTAVAPRGAGFSLTSPSDKAFLFDSRTGVFRAVPEIMPSGGRGAAGATFLPVSRRVVVYGGATELRYDPAGGVFPFSFVSTSALNTYEVLDLQNLEARLADPASPDPIFLPGVANPDGSPNRMRLGRVFPRGLLLEVDDAVLVTGGGLWPRDSNASFGETEYYHPRALDGRGGFVDPKGSLVMNAVRSGHSFTSLGVTPEGFSRGLLWGGTEDNAQIGELFIQGSSSGALINGVFIPAVLSGDVPPPPYFHAAAPVSSSRVLVVGGAEPAGGGTLGIAPAARAYFLDVSTEGSLQRVNVTALGGMDAPRYFGALAVSADAKVASVVGGWTTDSGTAATAVLTADLRAQPPVFSPDTAVYAGRGAMGAAVLPLNDVLFLVGGAADPATFDPSAVGAAETFVPALLTAP